MGGFDLDPASEAVFNETIRAEQYYSLTERQEDGLVLPWRKRVICNPPGGLVLEFWECAIGGTAEQVFWIGFSVEQLCLLGDASAHPADFSLCFLRKRIPFVRADHAEGVDHPSHGNYVAGIGIQHAAFEAALAPYGKVCAGKYALIG